MSLLFIVRYPIFIILFVGCINTVAGQDYRNNLHFWPVDEETGKIAFRGNDYLPAESSDSLFFRAIRYLNTTYNTPIDSILYFDLVINSFEKSCHVPMLVSELGDRGLGLLHFNFKIQCRYRNIKYTITNIVHEPLDSTSLVGGALENETAGAGGRLFPRRYWDQTRLLAFDKIQTAIDMYRKVINSPASGSAAYQKL